MLYLKRNIQPALYKVQNKRKRLEPPNLKLT